MLDFPDTPVDGDTHTEEGRIWTYSEPPGVWAVGDSTGDLTTIVTADAPSGWQVWGDTLIQWGTTAAHDSNGQASVNFVKAFKTVPNVVVAPSDVGSPATNVSYTAFVRTASTTGFSSGVRNQNNGTTGSFNTVKNSWIAVGEALDADRLPKEVPVADSVAGGAYFAEFHDTTGAASSWRIVGTTLECWGICANSANGTTIFPKTFARAPVVTTSMAGGGSSTTVNNPGSIGTTSFVNAKRAVNANNWNNSTNDSHYHAVGEWDGIS